MQNTQLVKHDTAQPHRMLLHIVIILALSAVSIAALLGLLRPSRAAAHSAVAAGVQAPAQPVALSPVMTYQVYFPLILRPGRNTAFGVQLYGGLTAANGFTRATQLATGWVRIPVYWSQIEPANTTPAYYNWSSMDTNVQAMQNSGINVVFTLDTNPAWAAASSGGPVSNTADLLEFFGALVARYPQVSYWEVYNEPDSIVRFGNRGNVYAQLLNSLYPVVKAANPAAQVVLGGLALDWFLEDGGYFDRDFLADVLAGCSGSCFDVANFHYYPAFRGTWDNYGPDIIGKATYVRQLMATYGFTRPVMVTELGWPAGTNWGSPELAARYVPKVYARSLATDLKAAVWFALLDADSSNPGLLDSVTAPGTLIPRPAFNAYQTWTSFMNEARYVGVVPTFDPIEGYQFTVNGSRLDVYWYDCPLVREPLSDGPVDCTNTKTHSIPATRVGVSDKYGATVIRNDGDDGVADGKVTLTIGTNPVYVDFTP